MAMEIQWRQEVEKRKQMLVEDLQKYLQIKSVLDKTTKAENAPFGKGIQEALEFMLHKGEDDGFIVKDVDGYAGHIEMGQGEDIVGILCHVDVVPEGEGWISNPYGAEIRDGNIYARGAIDDKGPTMAAYYGMKIVQELGLPLKKRIRMILGTDEESNWECVKHYFQKEEMPAIGFAPDADFPIIYAEKGILDVHVTQKKQAITGEPILLQFDAGVRLNMVPDLAKATLASQDENIITQYNEYLISEQLTGKCWIESKCIHIELNGKAAHGSEPQLGKNAGILLAKFLDQIQLDEQSEGFVQFAINALENDKGMGLGIQYWDEITGDLTVNIGMLRYTAENAGEFGLNIRYPVTANPEQIKESLKVICETSGYLIDTIKNSPSHHVDKNHPLITTLQKVYEEQTGEMAELLAIGGGTYAKALEAGVAFGALFPGKPDVAHQKDEYINIEDLLKTTAIYAQAMYELANNENEEKRNLKG